MLPAHYVRPNETTRLPRCHVYLDCEARVEAVPKGEVQTFRLAVAAHDCRRSKDGKPKATEWAGFGDPEELWRWVSDRCRKRHRTILVAHNLAYDLRVSGAFLHLPALDWELKAVRLDGAQAWAVWRRDGATLTMVDTMAWLPTGLDRIGAMVELHKPELPDDPDDEAAWAGRCVADVVIVREAWRRLLAWIEREDLGNWKPTGAGQAWAAFRHRFYTHRLLVHDDSGAREAERRAAWTGRCEAWRWGQQRGGPFTEWDMEAAYCRIARDCEVPTRLVGHLTRLPRVGWRVLGRRRAVLARCTVETEVPVVPTLVDGFITWPVGRFESLLWDTELALAEDEGARVAVHEAWVYQRAPALREFASWVLGVLEAPEGEVDPVERTAVKHWSRALVGRFGARWSSWEEWGDAPFADLSLGTVHDVGAGETFRMLHLGYQLLRDSAERDSPDAMPQVMSWIMAECRRRLWLLLGAVGWEHVVYCDTDSVIVDRAGDERLRSLGVASLRVKGRWRDLEVLGPRQLVLGHELRASGVPRGARRVGEHEWRGEVWPALGSSIARGEADRVRVTERTVRIEGRDRRREHLAGGLTAPWRVPRP